MNFPQPQNSMKTPSILPLTTLAIAAMSIVTNGQQPRPLPAGVEAHRDLPYVENGHQRQKLDLYLPEKAERPLPVIVWVHGGGWRAGDKGNCPALSHVSRGYAVASIGYRLSGDAIFPAQIEDCKAALRWLRANAAQYRLDSQRIGAWGSSAGGHLVALLGTSGNATEFEVGAHRDQSSAVQAVCDFYGPTDLLQMDAHAPASSRLKHDPAESPESRLIGGAIQENKAKTQLANPIRYVTKTAPPFLIVHGDEDSTVPHHQSQLLFDALKQAGTSVHFHTIKGAGHGGPGFAGAEIDPLVAEFFDRHLKSGQTPQPMVQTTESVAAAKARVPSPGRSGAAAEGRLGGGMSWERISGREDKNGDGKVTKEEFTGPPILFQRLDSNRDGVLTREEVEGASSRPAPATSR